jgi:16S rRNA (guanine1516-N2)-methyltransferase
VTPCTTADADRCRRFKVPVAERAGPAQWTLRRTAEGQLELHSPAAAPALCVALDLRSGPLARRLHTARRDQPLPRALGLHRRQQGPTVFDATAGLGRDALLLARLGCRVTACERVPALAMMLDDAAARAGLGPLLQVVGADATVALGDGPAQAFDVVYLDPMFPEPGRAQVKKEMQVCRLLAGPPEDMALLLHRAFAAARERVVIKRHPHEQPLTGTPSFTVAGERVRFDVHLRAVRRDTPDP